MIESVEQAFRTHLNECAVRAADAFDAAVRPIFGEKERGGRPEHVASCILLNVDGRRVLSTAAHVLNQLAIRHLYVGGPIGTTPVEIAGGQLKTTSVGDARSDRFDCAFWVLPDAAAEALGAVEFLSDDRLFHNRIATRGRHYTALGYPVSRNDGGIDHSAKSIVNHRSIYTATLIAPQPEFLAKLGIAGAMHLFLNFEKYSLDTAGRRIRSFSPIGMSGGALLDLGNFNDVSTLTRDPARSARLCGMLIEHHRHHKAMIATKIGPIVAGIRRALA